MSLETSVDQTTNSLLQSVPATNSGKVRHVFEDTSKYLKRRQVDVRFRIDTVAAYAAEIKPHRILDIGCGDGSISLQLAGADRQLTLMDISSSMVATATANIPCEYAANVRVRQDDFAVAEFDQEPFDLIVTVGVMAHVDSPDEFLKKIRSLLRPGGSLILEFTDAFHVVGKVGRMWSWTRELFAPAKYATNKLSYAQVAKLLDKNKLRIVSTFRYSRIPLPGFNSIVSHPREFALMKAFFGSSERNRNAWLGNEYIMRIVAE
jgi:cyclopropane fatty-acyl-phospholipid synthase-like methyltransferase